MVEVIGDRLFKSKKEKSNKSYYYNLACANTSNQFEKNKYLKDRKYLWIY